MEDLDWAFIDRLILDPHAFVKNTQPLRLGSGLTTEELDTLDTARFLAVLHDVFVKGSILADEGDRETNELLKEAVEEHEKVLLAEAARRRSAKQKSEPQIVVAKPSNVLRDANRRMQAGSFVGGGGDFQTGAMIEGGMTVISMLVAMNRFGDPTNSPQPPRSLLPTIQGLPSLEDVFVTGHVSLGLIELIRFTGRYYVRMLGNFRGLKYTAYWLLRRLSQLLTVASIVSSLGLTMFTILSGTPQMAIGASYEALQAQDSSKAVTYVHKVYEKLGLEVNKQLMFPENSKTPGRDLLVSSKDGMLQFANYIAPSVTSAGLSMLGTTYEETFGEMKLWRGLLVEAGGELSEAATQRFPEEKTTKAMKKLYTGESNLLPSELRASTAPPSDAELRFGKQRINALFPSIENSTIDNITETELDNIVEGLGPTTAMVRRTAASMRLAGNLSIVEFWRVVAEKALDSNQLQLYGLAKLRGMGAAAGTWMSTNPKQMGAALLLSLLAKARWEVGNVRNLAVEEYGEFVRRAGDDPKPSLEGSLRRLRACTATMLRESIDRCDDLNTRIDDEKRRGRDMILYTRWLFVRYSRKIFENEEPLTRIVSAVRGEDGVPGVYDDLKPPPPDEEESDVDRRDRMRKVAEAAKPYIKRLQRVQRLVAKRLQYVLGARNADRTTTPARENAIVCLDANVPWVENYFQGPRVDCDGNPVDGDDDDYGGGDDDDDDGGGDDGPPPRRPPDDGGDDGDGGDGGDPRPPPPRRRPARSPARRVNEPAALMRNAGQRARRVRASMVDEIVNEFGLKLATASRFLDVAMTLSDTEKDLNDK